MHYFVGDVMVPAKGLEPPRCCQQKILSLPRLPFRHAGTIGIIAKPGSDYKGVFAAAQAVAPSASCGMAAGMRAVCFSRRRWLRVRRAPRAERHMPLFPCVSPEERYLPRAFRPAFRLCGMELQQTSLIRGSVDGFLQTAGIAVLPSAGIPSRPNPPGEIPRAARAGEL